MPPNHNRSIGALSNPWISSFGVRLSFAGRSSAARISGVILIDLALRSKTPPPAEIFFAS